MTSVSFINKRLTLQAESLVEGEAVWSDVGAFWGELTVLKARRQGDPATHKIVARYQQAFDIGAGQRLALEGRLFLIRRVADLYENKKWLVIEAEELDRLGP